MRLVGEDFIQALKGWRYNGYNAQPFWVAILCFFAVGGLQLLLPVAAQVATVVAKPDVFRNGLTPEAIRLATFVTIAALIPTSIFTAWFTTFLANKAGGDARQSAAMQFPRFGFFGWVAILVSFIVAFGLVSVAIRFAFADTTSIGGVEKAVSSMKVEPWAKIMIPLSIGFAGPIAEEFIFRGPIFAKIARSSLGPAGAVLLTSLVFASVHAGTQPLVALVQLFFMAVILGLILLRTGSIWSTIVCHGFWNLMTTLVLFNVEMPV